MFNSSYLKASVRVVGNGGYVLNCNDTNKPTELLDFFEWSTNNAPIEFLPTPSQNPINLALKMIVSLQDVDNYRYHTYKYWINNFFNEVRFVDSFTLSTTNDFDVVALPDECELIQTIVQREPIYNNEKRYTIDRNIWENLSIENKAGLILHEVIYREAASLKQTDSRRVRHLTGYLANSLNEGLGSIEYQNTIYRSNFPFEELTSMQLPKASLWILKSDETERNGLSFGKVVDSSDGSKLIFNGQLSSIQTPNGPVGFAMMILPGFELELNTQSMTLSISIEEPIDFVTISFYPRFSDKYKCQVDVPVSMFGENKIKITHGMLKPFRRGSPSPQSNCNELDSYKGLSIGLRRSQQMFEASNINFHLAISRRFESN